MDEFRVGLTPVQRRIVEAAVRQELPSRGKLLFQGVVARPLVSGWIVCGWAVDVSATNPAAARVAFQVSLDSSNSALTLIDEPTFLVKECSRWGLDLMTVDP